MKKLLTLIVPILVCYTASTQIITSASLKEYVEEIRSIQLACGGKVYKDVTANETYTVSFPLANFDVLFSSGLGFKAEYKAADDELLYVTEEIDLSNAKAVTPQPVKSKSGLQMVAVIFPAATITTKMIEKGSIVNTIKSNRINFYYETGNSSAKARLTAALNGLVKLLSKNAAFYHQELSGNFALPDGMYRGTFVGVNKRREGTGTFEFKDGSVYTGDWKNDKMHGKGTLTSSQVIEISGDEVKNRKGLQYVGQWVEGKLQGRGTLKGSDIYFEGNFVDGRIEGIGTIVSTGSVKWTYNGEWKNFRFHGKGTWTRDQHEGMGTYETGKQKYEGYFISGKREGPGSLTTSSGRVYEGEWKNDKLNGLGEYADDRYKYTGGFLEGKHHGFGTYQVGGFVYAGQWKYGMKHGKGEAIWENGDRYNGMWEEDLMIGKGMMLYANGSKYDGEWRAGKKYEGSQTWKDGSTYTGEWSEDTMHGKGTMIYPNGDRYEGEWKRGKPDGMGVLYNKNNEKMKDLGTGKPALTADYLRSKTEVLSRNKTYFINYTLTDSTFLLYIPKNLSHTIYFDLQNNNKVDGDFDLKYMHVYPQGYFYKFFALSKGIYSVDKILPSRRDSSNILELTFNLKDIVNRRSNTIAFQVYFKDADKEPVYLPKRKEEINFSEGNMFYIKLTPQ